MIDARTAFWVRLALAGNSGVLIIKWLWPGY
jgi:hypothetical protein